jgi:hypothetical protein
MTQMNLDCGFGYVELTPDLAVRQPLRYQTHDLLLAAGQLRQYSLLMGAVNGGCESHSEAHRRPQATQFDRQQLGSKLQT